MAPSDPAERHRRVAAAFGERVSGVSNWDAPTPVAEWVARDVLGHLLDWFGGFLAAGTGIELPEGPAVERDPVGAWSARAAAVQALLDDPGSAGLVFELPPHIAPTGLSQAIDRFYTSDVFMHTWDLARSSGQDESLDPRECAALLAGMEPLDQMLRASGQYGPAVEVASDADPVERLMAFIGRDPDWWPPA